MRDYERQEDLPHTTCEHFINDRAHDKWREKPKNRKENGEPERTANIRPIRMNEGNEALKSFAF